MRSSKVLASIVVALVIIVVSSIFAAGYFYREFNDKIDVPKIVEMPSEKPTKSTQQAQFVTLGPGVTLKPLQNESTDLAECANRLTSLFESEGVQGTSIEELREATDYFIDLCMKQKGYTNY